MVKEYTLVNGTYQIIDHCKDTGFGAVEIATRNSSKVKIYDFANRHEYSLFMRLKRAYEDNVQPWKKKGFGCFVDVCQTLNNDGEVIDEDIVEVVLKGK